MKSPSPEVWKWAQHIRTQRLSEVVHELDRGARLRGRVISLYPDGWILLSVRGYRVLVYTSDRPAVGSSIELFARGSALAVKELCRSAGAGEGVPGHQRANRLSRQRINIVR